MIDPGVLSKARMFWVDQPERAAALAAGIRALHAVDEIPWPSEMSVIGTTDDWVPRVISGKPEANVQLLFYDRSIDTHLKSQRGSIGKCAGFEYRMVNVHTIAVRQLAQERNVISMGEYEIHQLVKVDFGTFTEMRGFLEQLIRTGRPEFEDRCDSIGFTEDRELAWQQVQEFQRSTWPESGTQVWLEQHKISDREWGTSMGIRPYSALVGMTFPCGYVLTARSGDGFGPAQAKERTRGARVLCYIGYDRLCRLTEEARANEGREVEPHYRRGHHRHMWKEAGLNRIALPDSAFERMKLVLEHKVRRVYVHPAWVGKRDFLHDGWSWSIHAGETEM